MAKTAKKKPARKKASNKQPAALHNKRFPNESAGYRGARNALLCQLTADACQRTVLAGPVEATAIGNVLTQLLGLGLIKTLDEGRAIVRRSFDVAAYQPRHPEEWQEPYRRFLKVL